MSISVAGGANVSISINGNQIQDLLHASISTSNLFSADSFALTFAIGISAVGDLDFWSSVATAYVEVSASAHGDILAQVLITGMIDTILIDPLQGTVAIEGRDLSSSMIDSYRQQDFVNQTASGIVSTIAQYHGLGAAIVATSGSIGRYYGDGYTRLSLGQFSRVRSDWDLVVQLARENEFDVFVFGTTLFFQPASSSFAAPIPIASGDIQRMRVERALTITPNASARVQSWNSQYMASYDSHSQQILANAGNPPFLFSSSNFTSQQVTDSASRYTAEIGRLATTLHLDMPWDFSLTPRLTILLCGTHSFLDRVYRIDSIDRHYSSKSGSTQSIRAVGI